MFKLMKNEFWISKLKNDLFHFINESKKILSFYIVFMKIKINKKKYNRKRHTIFLSIYAIKISNSCKTMHINFYKKKIQRFTKKKL